MVTDKELLQQMRDVLVPKGTADLVRISGKEMYFSSSFIASCINELSRIRLTAMLGEEPSPLQKLAYELLKDSALVKELK